MAASTVSIVVGMVVVWGYGICWTFGKACRGIRAPKKDAVAIYASASTRNNVSNCHERIRSNPNNCTAHVIPRLMVFFVVLLVLDCCRCCCCSSASISSVISAIDSAVGSGRFWSNRSHNDVADNDAAVSSMDGEEENKADADAAIGSVVAVLSTVITRLCLSLVVMAVIIVLLRRLLCVAL